MKRWLVAALLALVLACAAAPAWAASDTYDNMDSYPLRVAAYFVYPVGFTAEWLIFRPLHYVISQPYLDKFFGTSAHDEMESD
jgi:hypothetical protein